jgi:glycosyltransferase involved in cell wall biosynthesis
MVKTPRPKRILLLNWRDTRHEDAGGAEVYAYELARRWKRDGHDGHSPRHETIDGVEIIRRGGFNFVYAWAFLYYITKLRKHTDIIVDCHNGIPFFTPLYSRKPVTCVVHHVHQEVFKQYMKTGPAQLAAWLERVAMPFVYRKCQYITVSESSTEGMVQELGINADHIRIVHNGIDLEHFVPGPKAASPTILYLGRLKAYKSVDVLVKAFASVLAKQPDAQLVIGGTGDAEPSLKKLVAELNLQDHVIFHGYVSEDDKVRLMQEAWVFCSPSYAEGWGITIIEANACGTPVVASNVPGLKESVRPPLSGFLELYGDVNAFADKLLYVLHDQKTRDDMSKTARTWASRFNWQDSAMKFLEVIT